MMRHDCPECKNWGSVYWFIALPSIWKCQQCDFLFEPRELVGFKYHPDF